MQDHGITSLEILKKCLTASASIAFALLLIFMFDKCAGIFLSDEDDLVFDPYSHVTYSTPEFHITANINNFGFRGEAFDPRMRRQFRVVTLGDSFTFGWGVDFEDTWPRVLETQLREKGIDVEVVNLGQPGAYPAMYGDIGTRANPMLKPDLVIVAITQGDDLAQTLMEGGEPGAPAMKRSVRVTINNAIKSIVPNLIKLKKVISSKSVSEHDATAIWKNHVAALMLHLSPDEKIRFDEMDAEIRGMFVRGELNPGLLAWGLRGSDNIEKTLDLENPQIQRGIQQIAGILLQIRASTEVGGGKLIIVALPHGSFVSKQMNHNYGRMGFTMHDYYLTTSIMDDAIRLAATKAETDFFEVTKSFRLKSEKSNLFYKFDGHYTAHGQRLFARGIEPYVQSALRESLPQDTRD